VAPLHALPLHRKGDHRVIRSDGNLHDPRLHNEEELVQQDGLQLASRPTTSGGSDAAMKKLECSDCGTEVYAPNSCEGDSCRRPTCGGKLCSNK